MNSKDKGDSALATASGLPANLPAGAKAFQTAIDGKLTPDIWNSILDAQIKKAQEGDRGAARFLLEYAGGVASMRGATLVQENHHHEHFHEPEAVHPAPRLTDSSDGIQDRTIKDFDKDRERRARRARNMVEAEK